MIPLKVEITLKGRKRHIHISSIKVKLSTIEYSLLNSTEVKFRGTYCAEVLNKTLKDNLPTEQTISMLKAIEECKEKDLPELEYYFKEELEHNNFNTMEEIFEDINDSVQMFYHWYL